MPEHRATSETDPFFEIVHDGQWNACVGVQGSEINYVEGYLDAARILADTLVAEELMGKRDTLVMPILYNARHGLELAMKYVVSKLVTLELIRVPEGRTNHHILRYWQHLEDANVADRGIRELVVGLEPYVRSLSRIDVDGQQLRYFTTNDNTTSLGNQAVVHLLLVRESVEKLATILGDLTHRVAMLLAEHPTGTKTTRCSRLDLSEIVEMMGPHATWAEDAFLDRKAAVMARFLLTKKAFSNAIDAIRKSRELAARVGIEQNLLHVDDAKVIRLAESWLEVYPPVLHGTGPIVVRPRDIGFEEIERHTAQVRKLVTDVQKTLSLEEFADVEAVFNIGRNSEFGEYYESSVDQTIRQHRLEEGRRAEKIRHIVSKTNLLDGLTTGLRRVGRPSLADQLVRLREAARVSASDGAVKQAGSPESD